MDEVHEVGGVRPVIIIIGASSTGDDPISQKLDALLEGQQEINCVLRRVQDKLGAIVASNEAIKQEVADLNEAVTTISAGVQTLNTNLEVARQQIAQLQEQGVAPETVASLTAAVDGAQQIADALGAAADPDQETPSVDDLPDPVEPTTPTTGGDTGTGEGTPGTTEPTVPSDQPVSGTDTGATTPSDTPASTDGGSTNV